MRILPPDTEVELLPLPGGVTEAGTFCGLWAVYGSRDRNGRTFLPGAFTATLAEWRARGTMPRVCWRHQATIGHAVTLEDTPGGVLADGRLWLDEPDVARLYNEVMRPAAADLGLSFAFLIEDSEPDGDGGLIVRRCRLLDDITLTPCPVNPDTCLVQLNGDGERFAAPTIRHAEALLRDGGATKTQAQAILARGYSALRDAGPVDLSPILKALNRATGSH